MPFRLIYILSDVLFVCLFYILHYRRKVVRQNLANAFPEKTAQEQKVIARLFYKNLCDILLESIKGFSLSEASIRERYVYENPELIDRALEEGRSVLLIGSHLTNWEWGVLSVSLWLKHPVVGIYKPLKQPAVNDYLKRLRQRWKLSLVSMEKIGPYLLRQRQSPTTYVFFSDQTPSNTRSAHWLEFFHQQTPFLPGVGKLACRTDYPVYLFDIRRQARGYYRVRFELLENQAAQKTPEDITKRYAERLEARIKAQPEDWLWSHKRWKHSRASVDHPQ